MERLRRLLREWLKVEEDWQIRCDQWELLGARLEKLEEDVGQLKGLLRRSTVVHGGREVPAPDYEAAQVAALEEFKEG